MPKANSDSSGNTDANPSPLQGKAQPVLQLQELCVAFAGETGDVQAVRGLDVSLNAGESLAIVGESGAGKSATSLAIMGLLPATARVRGSIRFRGEELLGRTDAQWSRLRGGSLAMIFQDPLSALTPVYTVGEQIVEALQAHQAIDRSLAMRRAVELLDLVGIPEPSRRAKAFPHEYSGGMRQRAMIAMAVANDPDVIIADEPTTALDVTIQAQVLEVLKLALRETHAALILVSHDLGVVAGIADRVNVMYAGKIVEQGSALEVFHQPRMPYTIGLLGSVPRPDRGERQPLATIDGSPPSLVNPEAGCPFAPRCPIANAECERFEPSLVRVAETPAGTTTFSEGMEAKPHEVACHHSDQLLSDGLNHQRLFPAMQAAREAIDASAAGEPGASGEADATVPQPCEELVLKLDGVSRHYPLLEGAVFRRRVGTVHAVDGIDLALRRGETLGLVGESGCGKSTTALTIMELVQPTSGTLEVMGIDVSTLGSGKARRQLRRHVQIVFQDPMASLDPRMPVFDLLAEPLEIHGMRGASMVQRIEELLKLVGLDSAYLDRYPQQLSGGQRQRIGIARALALEPAVLVLDEPVSALDVSIRAGIINLLESLRQRLGLSYLFVAHDLAIVRHIADRVAVMYLGTIVETGEVDAVYERPQHPYTQALLSAMPIPDPTIERNRQRLLLAGELPSPANPPSGCRFHTRCPKKRALSDLQQRRCVEESPALRELFPAQPVVAAYADAADDSPVNRREVSARFTALVAQRVACHFFDQSPAPTS